MNYLMSNLRKVAQWHSSPCSLGNLLYLYRSVVSVHLLMILTLLSQSCYLCSLRSLCFISLSSRMRCRKLRWLVSDQLPQKSGLSKSKCYTSTIATFAAVLACFFSVVSHSAVSSTIQVLCWNLIWIISHFLRLHKFRSYHPHHQKSRS